MSDGLFSGLNNPSETTEKEKKEETAMESNRTTNGVANITKEGGFGNLPSKKEELQDRVEAKHFQSGGANQSGNEKRKARYLGSESVRGKTPTLKQIPVCAGGPYLCDSDSDVTAPISMVEDLETVEDAEW